jgi:rare lipoprotein A
MPIADNPQQLYNCVPPGALVVVLQSYNGSARLNGRQRLNKWNNHRQTRGQDFDLVQCREVNIGAITKSRLFVAVLLQVILLESTNAADRKLDECGLASIYSSVSEKTASGEDTLPEDFTAAHRSLPFGTLVHVDNQKNGRSAVVRITDRGPFISGRIIDVSQAAARALDISNLTPVCLKITWVPESRPIERK